MGGNIVPETSFFEGLHSPEASGTQNTKLVSREVFFEGSDPPEASGTQNTKFVCLWIAKSHFLVKVFLPTARASA